MTKVTFTLDEPTIVRLQEASSRLGMPKSQIVREAMNDFYERMGRLSERERTSMLKVFDELVPKIVGRSAAEVDAELAEIRSARRKGGRRTPALSQA